MKNRRSHVTHVLLSQRAQERVSERIIPADSGQSKSFALGGVAALAFLLTIGAVLFSPLPVYISGFIAIGSLMWVLLILLAVFGSRDGAKPGMVRYRANTESTWVSLPPLLGPLVSSGFALLSTALAVYSVGFVAVGVVQNDGNIWGAAPRMAWILGFISIVLSVYAWRMSRLAFCMNTGISLSPDRVGINHEHHNLTLDWNQITKVTAEAVNKGSENKKRLVPCVRIDAGNDRVFYVDIVQLGSDPNVVAALMQFYLDRPQYRDALVNPEEAIRRFSNAQA